LGTNIGNDLVLPWPRISRLEESPQLFQSVGTQKWLLIASKAIFHAEIKRPKLVRPLLFRK